MPALLLSCFPEGACADTGTINTTLDFFDARLAAYSHELETFQAGGPECSDRYTTLFDEDTLNISIFIGFGDSNIPNLLVDRPIRQALAGHLMGGCAENRYACGFAAAAALPDTNPLILTKTMLLKSRKKNIVLKIFDSSVSQSYSLCLAALRERQETKSDSVTRQYLKALEHDDIILYMGHSRYGTGPGFRPLPFFSSAGIKTFIRRPLLSEMREALKNSPRSPAIIGFFSCLSEKFYAEAAHSASPGSALLVSSDLATHADNVLGLLGFLDSVLGMRCRDTLHKSVNQGGRVSLYNLYGFLDMPHPRYRPHTPVLYSLAVLLSIPFFIIPASRLLGPGRAFPPAPPAGKVRGVVFPLLCALPGLLLARLSGGGTALALPLVFSLSGALLLTSSLYARRIAAGELRLFAGRTLPFLSSAAVVCFCLIFLSRPSLDNAAYSLLQTLKLSFLFFLLLPFFMLSENIFLAPFAGAGMKGFVSSMTFSLAWYFALSLGLNGFGARITLSLGAVFAFVLYKQSVSFVLYRHRPDMSGPVVFQTLTTAWIFAEGMQILMYN